MQRKKKGTQGRQSTSRLALIALYIVGVSLPVVAQQRHHLELRTDYVGTSDMRDSNGSKDDEDASADEDGNPYGHSDLWKTSLRYASTLSTRTDTAGRVRVWTVSASAFYCRQTGEGEARERNPEEIIAATVGVGHVRQLSERWQMTASASAGMAAQKDYVGWQSILVNAACLFTYQLNKQMSLTVGGAASNLYGVPIVLPMMGFSYRSEGALRFGLEMLPQPRLTATADLSWSFQLCLTAIEMDGAAAVVKQAEGTRLYTTTLMRSYLSPTLRLSRTSSLYLNVGVNYLRTTRLSRRSYDGFFRSFSSDSEKRRFRPTPLLGGGVKINF